MSLLSLMWQTRLATRRDRPPTWQQRSALIRTRSRECCVLFPPTEYLNKRARLSAIQLPRECCVAIIRSPLEGKQRNLWEYKTLLEGADFTFQREVDTGAGISIIEALAKKT